ncbi:MAG: tellurium resistance protein TerC [Phycisphaerales bacterium]|nr:tellurium resistance protein TerC [Phycisphaerales bacterium]
MLWPLWLIFVFVSVVTVSADWLFAHRNAMAARGNVATLMPLLAAILFSICLWLSVVAGWFGGGPGSKPAVAAPHSQTQNGIAGAVPGGVGAPVELIDATHPVAAFWTGYILELSLSADNVMLFVVIMRAFAVPRAQEAYVLFWGIAAALVLRVVFIISGLALILHISWALGAMGALLAAASVLMLLRRQDAQPGESRLIRWFQRVLPLAEWQSSRAWLVRSQGKTKVTPLLAVIAALAVVDVIFAFDSIPAIFGITTVPLLVVSSNVLAVLSLHRFYYLLATLVPRLRYLEFGLGIILLFIGLKMALPEASSLVGHPVKLKIPLGASLTFMAAVLTASVLLSWWRRRQ